MQSKALVLADAIFGLAAGIILLFGIWFALASSVMAWALLLMKVAAIALGIITLVAFKGTGLVKTASCVLLIAGGAVGLIPFLGWVGGILLIIGGGITFPSLKNFD